MRSDHRRCGGAATYPFTTSSSHALSAGHRGSQLSFALGHALPGQMPMSIMNARASWLKSPVEPSPLFFSVVSIILSPTSLRLLTLYTWDGGSWGRWGVGWVNVPVGIILSTPANHRVMRRGAPVAMTVAGSDSSGGAGIQADLKAFAVVGVHGASVITAVTAQNSRGVRGLFPLAIPDIEAQIDAVAQDMGPRWAKTGLLYDPRTVRAVAGRMAHHNIDVVVDPVIVAGSGDALSERGLLEAIMSDLLPRATMVTPNVDEASQMLRGRQIATAKEMRKASTDILELGPSTVLLKGGHMQGTIDVVDILCTGPGVFEEFRHPRLPGSFHGTGCTLSALITGYLAKGESLESAVGRAERVQYTVMASAYAVGGGALYLDHMAPVKMAALRWEVARYVRLAARQLELMLTDEWLPEIGTNIVFALPNASVADEVAALTGRINRVCKHAQALGHVNFGASKYMARVVLAAMTVDETMRAAVNIKRSPDHLRRAREAGLVVASFERSMEPANAPKDIEWGTLEAIRVTGGVPDVIEDAGGQCLEPVMRVLGHDPAELVDKVRRIMSMD